MHSWIQYTKTPPPSSPGFLRKPSQPGRAFWGFVPSWGTDRRKNHQTREKKNIKNQRINSSIYTHPKSNIDTQPMWFGKGGNASKYGHFWYLRSIFGKYGWNWENIPQETTYISF